MREIVFEVRKPRKAATTPERSGTASSPRARTRDDLKDMVRDAVLCHFDDGEAPRVIRLHVVREDAIAV